MSKLVWNDDIARVELADGMAIEYQIVYCNLIGAYESRPHIVFPDGTFSHLYEQEIIGIATEDELKKILQLQHNELFELVP